MWNRVLFLALVLFSAIEVKSRAKPSKGKGKGKGKPSSPRPSVKPSPATTMRPASIPTSNKCSNFLAIDMHYLKLPKILSSGHKLVSCKSDMPYKVEISYPSSCSEVPEDSFRARASLDNPAILTFDPPISEFYLLHFPIGDDVLRTSSISPPANIIHQNCKMGGHTQYFLVAFDAPTGEVRFQYDGGYADGYYYVMVADCTDKLTGSSSTVSVSTISTTPTATSSSSSNISTTVVTTTVTANTTQEPGHCEDGKPDPVDTKKKWTTGCLDIDGNSYLKGEYLESCCGCFKFSCFVMQYNTTLIPPNYFWEKVRSDSCCSDCDGTVYPAGSVMQSRDLADDCKTTITTQCIFINKQQKAVVQESSRFQQCCSNSSGVYPTGTSMLYPETCSIQECLRPSGREEASWISSPVLQGCNCCAYKGKLVQNGGWVILTNGDNATCCEGRLLTAVENSSPTSSTSMSTTTTTTTRTPTIPITTTTSTKITITITTPTTSTSTTPTTTTITTTTMAEILTFPDNKCFSEDNNITFHDLGLNHWPMGNTGEKPEWIIDSGGRRVMEMLSAPPAVALYNPGDSSTPVTFSGRVFSNASGYGVIGMVFGYQNESNFFVVASSQPDLDWGGFNWYIGRLHATCGDSCQTSKTVSNAIWFPHKHPEDITVLKTGSNLWTIPNKYKFSICFDPSDLMLSVSVSRVVEDGEDVLELNSINLSVRTHNPVVDAISRLGGLVGVYADSQMLTTWDQLECMDCHPNY